LDPNIVRANGITAKWAEDDDSKLKEAVQTHGSKNWAVLCALVPGRTKEQCWDRWHTVLRPNIDCANRITARWAEDEDSKLKEALQTHGGKNWDAIATLVPGRTITQCYTRWHYILDPIIDRANRITAKWAEDEDSKLKEAVKTHGGKHWKEIAMLIPGRTRTQCWDRWHTVLRPNIDWANRITARWAEDEDSKLKDAVRTHGGKDWNAISSLVPGRTRNQCSDRWHNVLRPNIYQANQRTCKWAEDEDSKLKEAVKTHGGKNWGAISALIPGRTRTQCHHTWNYRVGADGIKP
jgi:hypothetical protein